MPALTVGNALACLVFIVAVIAVFVPVPALAVFVCLAALAVAKLVP